jgi:prolyl 4-hydroxylase
MPLTLKSGYEIGDGVWSDPLVWVVDDFVTQVEREHIVDIAAKRMTAAKVSRFGANELSEKRTGSVAWVKHDQTPIVRGLVKRVGTLLGVPTNHSESLQVIHYGETQEYRPHYDAWDIETAKGREKTAIGGNRAVTVLMYLNEVEAGGGTIFPNLDIEVDAVPGRMCIFHDLAADSSNRHVDSLHGGTPVLAGEKWACNLWFREERYQKKAPGTVKGRSSGRSGHAPNRPNRKAQRASRKRNR